MVLKLNSLKTNKIFLILTFSLILYFFAQCNSFVFFEYFKIKFSSVNNFRFTNINTQFVSSTNQYSLCYLTISEAVTSQYGDIDITTLQFNIIKKFKS